MQKKRKANMKQQQVVQDSQDQSKEALHKTLKTGQLESGVEKEIVKLQKSQTHQEKLLESMESTLDVSPRYI